MSPVIAVALSGGIDSLTTAALLKERGYQLLALHFVTGFETVTSTTDNTNAPSTCHDQASRKLAPLSEQLDVPIHIIDLRREFKSIVVDYFIGAYQQGQTPNPCLVCNPGIKFDILFEKARALGANRIATGHYARNVVGADGRRHLLRAADHSKDQSYFLARLTQTQLAHSIFPLAALTKSQTREMAAERGLQPVSSRESQDICFINETGYAAFLERQPGFESRPGPIEDVQGRIIGQHAGLHRFTIGQRRGINCPAAQPYYVVRIDSQRNCLVVGYKKDLLTEQCRVNHINWIVPPPERPLEITVKVRYRHTAVPAIVTPLDATAAMIRFERSEAAVTPGQGAVFYQDDEVLGGGWIQ